MCLSLFTEIEKFPSVFPALRGFCCPAFPERNVPLAVENDLDFLDEMMSSSERSTVMLGSEVDFWDYSFAMK